MLALGCHERLLALDPGGEGHVRSFSTHGHLSAAKGSSSTSHARNPFNLNFLIQLCGLMVRKWRLIGYFPILYNPGR
jgi:hypothetical protein